MRIVIGFILGLVIGYAATLFGWVGYTELAGVQDRDGGKIMGIAFVVAPAVAVLAGIAGAIFLHRLHAGRNQPG